MRPTSARPEAETPHEVLAVLGHVLRDDGEEDDVVHAEDDLEDRQREQGDGVLDRQKLGHRATPSEFVESGTGASPDAERRLSRRRVRVRTILAKPPAHASALAEPSHALRAGGVH